VVANDERLATADSDAGESAGSDSGASGGDDPDASDDADAGDADDRGDRQEADDDEPTTPRDLEEAAGFGLGGAEQLGSLLVDCERDSDMACDVLFQISAFDSVEEAAALMCGGRSDVEVVFCTEGIENAPGQLFFDIDSEGLDRVLSLCEDDGDMTACDLLFFRSPVESELEEIGATCGGRVNVAVPDCRTALPG